MSYLIVGLGNKGLQYQGTRHNVGFQVVEAFAKKQGWVFHSSSDCKGSVAHGEIYGKPLFLVKPSTLMNLSGRSVKACMQKLKVPNDQLLIVNDDTAFACGDLRLKSQGSAGGHNGLKSVAESLQTNYYARLRVGIGAPGREVLSDYVLDRFTSDEEAAIEKAVEKAVFVLDVWLQKGQAAAMQIANQRELPKADKQQLSPKDCKEGE